MNKNYIINKDIKDSKIFLLDENNNKLGTFDLVDALQKAKEHNKDLVKFANNANGAVCKLINYQKLIFDERKLQRKNLKNPKTKEIKIGMFSDTGDVETKIIRAKSLLLKKHKILLTVYCRGRQIIYQDRAKEIVDNFVNSLKTQSSLEKEVTYNKDNKNCLASALLKPKNL